MKLLFGYGVLGALLITLQGCGGGGGDATTTTGGTTTVPVSTVPTTTPTAPAPTSPTTVNVESSTYLAAVSSVSSLTVGTQLETFDTSGSLGGGVTGWLYEPGSEFPGARGGLTLVSGEKTPSLAGNLAVDLNCGGTTYQLALPSGCGKYVAMSRKLGSLFSTATPDTAMISMDVQTSQPLLGTGLRVVDGSGQVLQYKFTARNLETAAGGTWARVMVPVGSSTTYWAGANDGQLHSGITAMSVTATTPTLATPAGNLKVDNVRLVDSGASNLALSRQSALLTNGVLPTVAGRFAVASHFWQLSDKELSQAASVGISVVRIGFDWPTVQSGGTFNFSHYDNILNQLAKHGMKAVVILAYGHPDYGGGAPVTSTSRAAFAEFARQSALFARGRNVIAFEVWNEPDNNNFWAGSDPEAYAQLLGVTRQAIKGADSTRKVINGGPSWVNLPYILKLAKTGQLNSLDGFAIHPYRPWAPETFAADVAPLKAVLSSQGITNPSIWATEWGYASVGLFDTAVYGNGHDPRARARQAVMVLRSVLTQTALNLPLMTIYELSDSGLDPNNGEHNFGLLTKAADPKPAFNALQTLYSFTKTRNYVGLVKDVPANVHAMRWDSSTDSVFAVWVDSTDVPLTLTVPKSATVTSWSGAAVTTTATSNPATAQLKLTEATGPVFVRYSVTVTQ